MEKIIKQLRIFALVVVGVLLTSIFSSNTNNKVAELNQCIDEKKEVSALKIDNAAEDTIYFIGCGGFF